jgi:hypothetical protein
MTRVIVAAFPYPPIAAARTLARSPQIHSGGVDLTLTVRRRVCNGVEVTLLVLYLRTLELVPGSAPQPLASAPLSSRRVWPGLH